MAIFDCEWHSSTENVSYTRCSVPGRVAQSVGHLTRKSGVLGSIPGLATYFCFSFRLFKKGSRQLLAKVCARSTGLSLPRKSVVRLTDRPAMTSKFYRGRKKTIQQYNEMVASHLQSRTKSISTKIFSHRL